MNAFKKLALAAAVASVPMVGVAMEPLNDEGLANVTGQDGITIGLNLNALEMNVYIEDTDGVDASRDKAGMIAVTGLVVDTPQEITIKVDSGSSGGVASGGVLRLDITVPELEINKSSTFEIGVAGTDNAVNERDAATGWSNLAGSADITSIMELGDISLANLNMAIELGPEASKFMTINTTTDLDIKLSNFKLTDASAGNGGQLFAKQVAITNLGINGTEASITSNGLEITLGTTVGAADTQVALMGLGFGTEGTTAPLGNVYIDGLDMGGSTVTVRGH